MGLRRLHADLKSGLTTLIGSFKWQIVALVMDFRTSFVRLATPKEDK